MKVVAYQDGGASRTARLGPVLGADEAALDGHAGAQAAFALLRRVARGADGQPLRVDDLSVSDADRMLAAIYQDLYDDQADCRLACGACAEPYQFTLRLSELMAAQNAERPPPPDADGAWALPDGRRARAPTLADVAAAEGPDDVLARVLTAGEPAADEAGLEAFLERAAPVLSLDVDARCPHCGSPEKARFDLAHYLGARLTGERAFLVRETHLIASRYGWSFAEILSLSRDDRRAYASLIEAERAAAQRPARRLA